MGQTQITGTQAEAQALLLLQRQGLRLLQRNYRTKRGEIDLIMQEQRTVVFVEVRARQSQQQGGAIASVDARKQRRIMLAAQQYLQSFAVMPACRFDVVAFDGEQCTWLKAAFAADC